MNVTLENTGKKYNRKWIFRHLNFTFTNGKYAIAGGNGSGKTTLLKVISGLVSPDEGNCCYSTGVKNIDIENIYRHISFVAPYIELNEELTALETLDFHSKFKRPLLNLIAMVEEADLFQDKDKLIKNFSSGMKQKIKLMMVAYFESEIILLDEPTSHLDSKAIAWYKNVFAALPNSIVIIASNDTKEYDFCQEVIDIENYKLLSHP